MLDARRDVGFAVPKHGLRNLQVLGDRMHPGAEAVAQRMEPEPLIGLDDRTAIAAGQR
jgi:hypothetical protein